MGTIDRDHINMIVGDAVLKKIINDRKYLKKYGYRN